jgi:hypothetical protein
VLYFSRLFLDKRLGEAFTIDEMGRNPPQNADQIKNVVHAVGTGVASILSMVPSLVAAGIHKTGEPVPRPSKTE